MTEKTKVTLTTFANSESAAEFYEDFYEQVVKEQTADDTPYRKIGCQLVQALLADDAEKVLEAITGWSVEDLLRRANLIDDDTQTTLDMTPENGDCPCLGCEYSEPDELGCCQPDCENCTLVTDDEYEKAKLDVLRDKYSNGTRIRLLKDMEDVINGKQNPNAPKAGDMGTVFLVDDAGQIHVIWDKGGSIAVLHGVDHFVVVKETLY